MALYFRTVGVAHPNGRTLILHLTCFAALVSVVEAIMIHGRGQSNPEALDKLIATYLGLFKSLYGENQMIFKLRDYCLCPTPYKKAWAIARNI